MGSGPRCSLMYPPQKTRTLTPADGLSEDAFMWVSQGTVPKSFQDPQIKPANMTGISGNNMQSLIQAWTGSN